MIAFVDEYWKIIHRAAGWDALRYWLLVSFFGKLFFFLPDWTTQIRFSFFFFLFFLLVRYFMQMLLSNRFLTGHDVAQVLVHYEDLVGMAFW